MSYGPVTRFIRSITLELPIAKPILRPANPAVLESERNTKRYGVEMKSVIGMTLSPVKAS